jgi:hypothetical protein
MCRSILFPIVDNLRAVFEISGSHGGEYEDQNLVGYNTTQSRWSRPTFQRCILPSSSGLHTRPYIPEGSSFRGVVFFLSDNIQIVANAPGFWRFSYIS